MTAPILVIKLGALGDLIQALGPLAAIRRHHADRSIVLLTAPSFVELARAVGLADEVWEDTRPSLFDAAGWIALRRRLRGAGFARVYDLQTSDRSGWYFHLFWPGPIPEWSGIARGCSHPHDDPARDRMHTVDRQRAQLARGGIAEVPLADLSGLARRTDVARFGLPPRFAFLAPGGAEHRPAKRWPVDRYAGLAVALAARGLVPVVAGGAAERALAAAIVASCPPAVDLTGATSLVDLAGIAGRAALAIGNDTGPMHVAAAAGCPSLVLFSRASNPALCAPRGTDVATLQRDDLADLPVETVLAQIRPR
jgi:ADP-heptose:LPS heptosyltransferase